MKLIMRNHSSSMKGNDERGDTHTHTCTLTVKGWTEKHHKYQHNASQYDDTTMAFKMNI